MNQDFIMQLLASFFDKFKAKNPKVAAIILTVLGAIVAVAPTLFPILGITNPTIVTIVQALAIFVGFITGSRTTNILAQSEEKKTIQ